MTTPSPSGWCGREMNDRRSLLVVATPSMGSSNSDQREAQEGGDGALRQQIGCSLVIPRFPDTSNSLLLCRTAVAYLERDAQPLYYSTNGLEKSFIAQVSDRT